MGNLPAVKSWVFYVMPDLYSGLWLFWLPGKHRRWIVSQFLGCRMSKCTIIHDGLCLKWTSLHHLFPMATLDGFTKDLPSWREGSRTIIQNDDNHANQIQSFLRAVEVIVLGLNKESSRERRSNPVCFLTSSHLLDLCMNRLWLSVWARRLKSFWTSSSSYVAQNLGCCSSSLS